MTMSTGVKGGIASCVLAAISMQATTSQASEQSEAGGFVADSHLTAVLRNYFWHQTGDLGPQRDWNQGVLANFVSGFTQGTVGIGMDAFTYANARLDGGGGRTGSMTEQVDGNGNPTHGYAKAGGSIKVRMSNTTLRYGDLEPAAPVFAVGNFYLLNQTASGFMVDSTDVPDLALHAGHFTSGTGYLTTSRQGELGLAYANVNTTDVDYAGAMYSLATSTSLTLYGSRYKDIMDQYYINANDVRVFSDDQSLTTDFNLYRSLSSGQAKAGDINLTSASLSLAYAFGAHTLTVAHQRIMGDTPQDYAAIGGTEPGVSIGKFSNGIYLANPAELSDFNSPRERSWQLRYDLNMEPYGVPGLAFMAKQLWGSHIDGTHVDNRSAYLGFYGEGESEHETNLSVKYTIQSGPAKSLAVTLVGAKHTGATSTGGDNTLTRLVVDYPISFF